uniref:Uncharacterized protein n=1 Tax=Anguilla anguilla TaxID=7936 RepID=A0A0E9QQC1_ANGAN
MCVHACLVQYPRSSSCRDLRLAGYHHWTVGVDSLSYPFYSHIFQTRNGGQLKLGMQADTNVIVQYPLYKRATS